MKSKVLLIGLLAAAGLAVAAGVTVAAGEVVSRPIGLNGAPDDLGRSLTPDSGSGQPTTVEKKVSVRKRKPADAAASELPAPATSDGTSGSPGSSGDSGSSGGKAKPAPREDAPASSDDDSGDSDDEDHGDEHHDEDD